MFKGTDKIGALNWTEEEPIYKEIIAKYDQMAEEADPVKKEAISKEINELTVKAGKLGLPNEYSNLMESMGAKGVNAGTYYGWRFPHNVSCIPYSVPSSRSWKTCTKNITVHKMTRDVHRTSS